MRRDLGGAQAGHRFLQSGADIDRVRDWLGVGHIGSSLRLLEDSPGLRGVANRPSGTGRSLPFVPGTPQRLRAGLITVAAPRLDADERNGNGRSKQRPYKTGAEKPQAFPTDIVGNA